MVRLANTSIRNMFYGATSSTFERAKALRNRLTIHELIIWNLLKNNQMLNLKFRRQHPIGKFVADFYCHRIKLVIEIDGESHRSIGAKDYDENRTAFFESFEIHVIRFENEEITANIELIKEKIEAKCKTLLAKIT